MTLGTCGRMRGSATGETGCRRLTFASFRTGSYITRSITCLETGNRRRELWAPLAHGVTPTMAERRQPQEQVEHFLPPQPDAGRDDGDSHIPS
ncbi:hypothetical protein BHE74_00030464 [Ensete ventricosum]|nr:hypothetical protein GW17_00059206 [Ensete ventricosum]RWW62411.1 hypothetical protein BHE74_00030464 [Ensete ventricosum]